jgi:hypothetical protein
VIKRQGRRYILYTKDGSRKLGEHPSLESAQAQERAITIQKARKKEGKDETGKK